MEWKSFLGERKNRRTRKSCIAVPHDTHTHSTHLDAKLLLVRTIETLQKLYMRQADKTGPLVTALRDSQENELGGWLVSEEQDSCEDEGTNGPNSTSFIAVANEVVDEFMEFRTVAGDPEEESELLHILLVVLVECFC